METPPTFGEWLRQRRRELDLTQDALARQVGCARITIRKLEANDIRPSRQLAELLVERLGVPAQDRAKFIHFGRSGALSGLATPPQHNLPTNPSSFVGRERELAAVWRLLAGARLVTVTGPGGIGKTRLALQATNDMLNSYPDGVWWIELAPVFRAGSPLTPPANLAGRTLDDLVPQAVVKAMRIPEALGQPSLDTLLSALREKKALLVLDNCEHLIEDCAALAELLLAECPAVSLLATSREALRVPGEKAWPLPAMSLPEADPAVEASHILDSEAVSLFVERAGEVNLGYQPGEAEARAIAQICRRLDGIPLAIELAAARVSLLTAQEIADRLDQRFSLLSQGRRTALARHQTLQAAIKWSHDLLGPPEQVLFRRLSVFSGSFTLAAAEAVCGGPELEPPAVLAVLGRLVDKSLVQVRPAPTDGTLSTRFHFLETIASFGRLKLDDVEETAWVRQQHANYYVSLTEAAEPVLMLQDQRRWFRLLRAEYDNLRAVIEWSVERDQADSGLRLVAALFWFWWLSGFTREGRHLALRVLNLPSARQHKLKRGQALTTAGFFQFLQGEAVSARQLLEEAIAILRASEEDGHLAWSLQFFGLVLAYEKEYALADAANQEGLAIARRAGDANTNSVFFFMGDVDLQKGDTARAKRAYEETAALAAASGSKSFQAYPVRRLGYLALEAGDLPTARRCFRESLELNHEVGDVPGMTACFASTAALALRLGQPVVAASLYGAVDNQQKTFGVNVLHTDRTELVRIRANLRSAMEEAAFAAAYSEGWALSLEQSLALANAILHSQAAVWPEVP